MSTSPMAIDEFRNALIARYLQPLQHPRSRADLEKLLEDRGVFNNAATLTETVDQFRLICAKLNSLFREQEIVLGSDLSAQAIDMCDELVEYAQRLPLSLPQAVVEEMKRDPKMAVD